MGSCPVPISESVCRSKLRTAGYALAVLLLGVSVGACTFAPAAAERDTASPTKNEGCATGERPVTAERCLALLDELGRADADRRAHLRERAAVAELLYPSPENRLCLGLIKGWPGDEKTDFAGARELLREVIDDEETFSRGARHLAAVYLRLIEQHEHTALERRQLRNALGKAQQQIEALTAIERTVQSPEKREENDEHKTEAARPPG
jgi:hypothetical protein